MVKEIKTPVLEPVQGIQAALDKLFLWNPTVALNLITQINAALVDAAEDAGNAAASAVSAAQSATAAAGSASAAQTAASPLAEPAAVSACST